MRDVFIPDRKGIKDALAARRRIPPDLETYFAELWDEIESRYFRTNAGAKIEGVSSDELKRDYEHLYLQFRKKGSIAVQEFVSGHSSAYLDEFIKANTLPIPTKANKEVVEEALASILAQRKAIERRR